MLQLPVPESYAVTLGEPLVKGPPEMEEKKRAGPTQNVARGMKEVMTWLVDVTSMGAAEGEG